MAAAKKSLAQEIKRRLEPGNIEEDEFSQNEIMNKSKNMNTILM